MIFYPFLLKMVRKLPICQINWGNKDQNCDGDEIYLSTSSWLPVTTLLATNLILTTVHNSAYYLMQSIGMGVHNRRLFEDHISLHCMRLS